MGNVEAEVRENAVAEDQANDVQARLAAIAAAMEAAKTGTETATKRNLPDGMACPIDPAERALCEGCQ